jgi:hypothetical protein
MSYIFFSFEKTRVLAKVLCAQQYLSRRNKNKINRSKKKVSNGFIYNAEIDWERLNFQLFLRRNQK